MPSTLPTPLGCAGLRINTRPTYWHCEPGWEWKAPPLLDYLLWYVLDGIGTMRLGERRWDLHSGVSFIYTPGSQPHGTQDPERRLVVFGMHFDFVDQHEQVWPEALLVPPPGHVVRNSSFFTLLAQHADSCWRSGHEVGKLQSHVFLQAMLLQLWEEAFRPAPSPVDLVLDQVVHAIQAEPGRRWRIEELAEQVHLSRAQFARRFQALVGRSPVHFIIQTRLERARLLIEETDMSLGQIAEVLGYQDVAFFSRQYKRYMGQSPGAARALDPKTALAPQHGW
jgi:AraC family transcriptional regulator of arabinose operon